MRDESQKLRDAAIYLQRLEGSYADCLDIASPLRSAYVSAGRYAIGLVPEWAW